MNAFILAVNGILFVLAVALIYFLSDVFGSFYSKKTPVMLVNLGALGLFYKFVPGLWDGFWQMAPLGFLNYLLIGVCFFSLFAACSIPDPRHESAENFREWWAITVSAVFGILWLPILMLIVLQLIGEWIWRNVIAEIILGLIGQNPGG